MKLVKITSIFRLSLQDISQYPAETLVRIFDNVFLSILILMVWRTIYQLNQANFEMLNQITLFYLAMPIFSSISGAWHGYYVAEEIRDGTFSRYLLQPISFIVYYSMQNLGEKLYKILLMIPFIIVAYYLFKPQFQISLLIIGISLLASILSWVFSFSLQTLVGILGFWLEEVSSINELINIATITFGGRAVPAFLFPALLFQAVEIMPFRYLTSFPVEIFTQSLTWNEITRGFIILFVWLFLVIFTSMILWKQGLKKYGAVGG